jgi:cytochrome c biogenesis factor
VLASIFAREGGYGTPETFVDGLVPAIWVGAVVVAAGAVVSLLIPRKRRAAEAPVLEPELVAQPEAA